jgi:hypothetical protein
LHEAISAFADNRTYTHVLDNGNIPSEAEVKAFHPGTEFLSQMITVANHYEQKEISPNYDLRIMENSLTMQENLLEQSEFLIVKNVREGSRLKINLDSPDPHIYFTISPNNGSYMEHRFWEGNMLTTGDVLIRVFAADEIVDGNFTLNFREI